MTDTAELSDRLGHYRANIERWQREAKQLRGTADVSRAGSPADTESLVGLERTADEIYAEIASFKDGWVELAETGPDAAGELADISETLHLLLLEITESGIDMYRSRSGLIAADEPTRD